MWARPSASGETTSDSAAYFLGASADGRSPVGNKVDGKLGAHAALERSATAPPEQPPSRQRLHGAVARAIKSGDHALTDLPGFASRRPESGQTSGALVGLLVSDYLCRSELSEVWCSCRRPAGRSRGGPGLAWSIPARDSHAPYELGVMGPGQPSLRGPQPAVKAAFSGNSSPRSAPQRPPVPVASREQAESAR